MDKSWNYRKIGDVCTVERGGSPRPIDKFITDDENGINWIKIGDTTDSMYITKTEQKIIPEGMKKSRYVKPGDFLLSNSMSFGRPYILQIDGCIHDGWLVLRDDDDLFDKRFLYYYLSSKTTYEKFKSMAVGGVVNNLNSEMVRNVEVPVPSKDDQSEIADLLDKLKGVIDNRKNELELLDELIKVRFVELFGDPVTNDKHWDMDTLLGVLEVGRTVTYGIVQTGDDVDEGIPVFRPIDIAGGHVPKREELKKTLPEISDKYKRTLLKGNELLITVRGSVGETFQVDEEFEGCNVGRNIVPLVTDKKRVNQRFLQELFAQKPIKDWLKAITKGIALQGLNMSEFKEMPVIIPDMGLQEEYVEFVVQVDKSKVAVQKALEKDQLLFDSLMQEYFG
ncbi:restriction endonuclease subunit S [Butyrivibrio sp. MB2005]|uniref:restriction endonuclease subunit S n=1 Tax=Butyrivibrio sp. MB2005 TaxID=1280678 RepID=UPI000421A44D|nr:restriction endonuclease subunit S [Butyrivibrio sp. MB2005]